MQINKTYAQTKYNVTRKPNRTVNYIVVHYTANPGSAKNHCVYFGGGDRQSSADYFIDKDGSIYQFNADTNNYYSWHCGDGKGAYGITNANSIGIECISDGEEFTQAQKDSLKNLTQYLMNTYKVSASNVVRHYDASRKPCPLPYCGSDAKNAKWQTLKTYITSKTTTPKEEYEVISEQDLQNIRNAIWNAPLGSNGEFGIDDIPAWVHLSWAHADGAYNRALLDKLHNEMHNTYDKVGNVSNKTWGTKISSGENDENAAEAAHHLYWAHQDGVYNRTLLDKLHTEMHNVYSLIENQNKQIKALSDAVSKLVK